MKVKLTCEICGETYMDEPPVCCCSGRDCGCMGRPIEPIVCSKKCYDRIKK